MKEDGHWPVSMPKEADISTRLAAELVRPQPGDNAGSRLRMGSGGTNQLPDLENGH
jgi:hypothetical protein